MNVSERKGHEVYAESLPGAAHRCHDGAKGATAFAARVGTSRGLVKAKGFAPQRVSLVAHLSSETLNGPTLNVACGQCYDRYDGCVADCDGADACLEFCERRLNRCLS